MNHRFEPAPFLRGKRLVGTAIGLTVSQPFLEHRISAQLIAPYGFRYVGKKDLICDVEVSRLLAPCRKRLFIRQERPRDPSSSSTAPVADGDFQVFRADRRAVRPVNLRKGGGAPQLFIEEIGKSGMTVLQNTANRQVIARVAPSDSANLVVEGNSINVYAPVRLLVYRGQAASLWGGMQYPDAPPLILSSTEFRKLWGSQGRAFSLAPESRLTSLGIDPAFEVLRSAGRVLLSNQRVRLPAGRP